jgi:hypothetical protein
MQEFAAGKCAGQAAQSLSQHEPSPGNVTVTRRKHKTARQRRARAGNECAGRHIVVAAHESPRCTEQLRSAAPITWSRVCYLLSLQRPPVDTPFQAAVDSQLLRPTDGGEPGTPAAHHCPLAEHGFHLVGAAAARQPLRGASRYGCHPGCHRVLFIPSRRGGGSHAPVSR